MGKDFASVLFLLSSLPFFFITEAKKLHAIRIRRAGLYPEGFDWDERHGHFIVGSMSTGALLTVSDAGVVEDFIRDENYAGNATLGILVDSPRNRVLAVVHGFPNHGYGFNALAAYDLVSKERIFFSPLRHDGETAVANDVAVDYAGNAYITNSAGNYVWKLNLNGEMSSIVKSDLFSSQRIVAEDPLAANCGLNGIVYDRNHYILVGQSNSGRLFRIELERMAVRVVDMKEALSGVDGMVLRKDGTMVAVSTHTAWMIRSRDHWITAEVLEKMALDSSLNTTAVCFRNSDHAYILNSYFQEFYEGHGNREIFSIEEIPLPNDWEVPLWLLLVILLFVLVTSVWRFQLPQLIREARRKRD